MGRCLSPFSPSFTFEAHVWTDGESLDLWQPPVNIWWSALVKFYSSSSSSTSEVNETVCYFQVHCRLMQVFACMCLSLFLSMFYSNGSQPFFKAIFTNRFLNSRFLISPYSSPLCEDSHWDPTLARFCWHFFIVSLLLTLASISAALWSASPSTEF